MSTGPDSLRIASAQYPIDQPGTIAAWQDKIARWVADGAATGAQLLVFPEYGSIEQAAAFGPEVCDDLQLTLHTIAEIAGERVAFHSELARQHGVHILVGSGPVLGEDAVFRNGAQLVTPDGGVGEQTKFIMTPFERNWGVQGGEPLRVFDTALGRVGIAICYDCEFPLLVRAMAESGAEVILIPSCTEKVSGFNRIKTGARARALENQIVAVTSPTIGDAPWSPAVDINVGAAGIYVPSEHGVSDDGILAEGRLNDPVWVVADVDLAGLRKLRTSGEMRNFTDWSEQPGAADRLPGVELVDLRARVTAA